MFFSMEDRKLTQRMFDIFNPLEIKVLDHIVVGGGNYVSMAEKNGIPDQRRDAANYEIIELGTVSEKEKPKKQQYTHSRYQISFNKEMQILLRESIAIEEEILESLHPDKTYLISEYDEITNHICDVLREEAFLCGLCEGVQMERNSSEHEEKNLMVCRNKDLLVYWFNRYNVFIEPVNYSIMYELQKKSIYKKYTTFLHCDIIFVFSDNLIEIQSQKWYNTR